MKAVKQITVLYHEERDSFDGMIFTEVGYKCQNNERYICLYFIDPDDDLPDVHCLQLEVQPCSQITGSDVVVAALGKTVKESDLSSNLFVFTDGTWIRIR